MAKPLMFGYWLFGLLKSYSPSPSASLNGSPMS